MGKPDGFYACGELNEHVVREVKKMMAHNATPKRMSISGRQSHHK